MSRAASDEPDFDAQPQAPIIIPRQMIRSSGNLTHRNWLMNRSETPVGEASSLRLVITCPDLANAWRRAARDLRWEFIAVVDGPLSFATAGDEGLQVFA
jgi:hypothetical protein